MLLNVFDKLNAKPATSGVVTQPIIGSKVGSLEDEWVTEDLEMRNAICRLEDYMKTSMSDAVSDSTELEQALPTIHHFAPSMYGREIVLPKGSIVVGKLHRHSHLNVLASGHVLVATEDGVEELIAPCIWTSKAGTKRVVQALENTVWVCVHPTNTTDIASIEQDVIAPTYAKLEE